MLKTGKTPDGSATLTRSMPDQIAGITLLFQSPERGGCAIGNLPVTSV